MLVPAPVHVMSAPVTVSFRLVVPPAQSKPSALLVQSRSMALSFPMRHPVMEEMFEMVETPVIRRLLWYSTVVVACQA